MDCKHEWELLWYEYKVPFLYFFTRTKRQDFHVCKKCNQFLFEHGIPENLMLYCMEWYKNG